MNNNQHAKPEKLANEYNLQDEDIARFNNIIINLQGLEEKNRTKSEKIELNKKDLEKIKYVAEVISEQYKSIERIEKEKGKEKEKERPLNLLKRIQEAIVLTTGALVIIGSIHTILPGQENSRQLSAFFSASAGIALAGGITGFITGKLSKNGSGKRRSKNTAI